MSLFKSALSDLISSARTGRIADKSGFKAYGRRAAKKLDAATGGFVKANFTKAGMEEHRLLGKDEFGTKVNYRNIIKFLKSSAGLTLSPTERKQLLMAAKKKEALVHTIGASKASILKAEKHVEFLRKKLYKRANKRLATSAGVVAAKGAATYGLASALTSKDNS